MTLRYANCSKNGTEVPLAREPLELHVGRRDRMSEKFWTISEVLEILQINDSFLASLEEEEIVCPICHEDSSAKLFSAGELEKVRLAKILVEEMEVNLPGVEVILRMRQNMIDMRRQFDAVLEDLARHLQDAPRRRP